jgi:glycosyltransferase involved in cell wall biosynthesis
MRVLWFSSSSGNYNVIKTFSRLGWVASLEKVIGKYENIELAVAFISDKHHYSIDNNVTYFGIEAFNNSRLKRLFERYFNKVEGEEYINKFLKVINDFNPDIIHIHGTENPFGYIIDKVNIPVVLSIQGNISVISEKFFTGISKKEIRNNTRLFDFIFKLDDITMYRRFLKLKIREQKILLNTKYIIGRTDWDRRITKILAPKSAYYYCGEIMRDSFYNQKWKPTKEKDTLILISVLGPYVYKGLETVLHTASFLIKIGLSFSWKIAGVNKKDRLARIVEGKVGIGLIDNNVKLLGSLNEENLVKELIGSDIFVATSHIENSPNNVCEAMLLGMPIIASYAGGTGSILQDKKEGILIQDGDPWSLAGAILELYNNFRQAIEYGENARNIALERHNPENVAQQVITTYKDILMIENKK